MKKIIYVLVITIACLSCKKEKLIDYAVVSGKILNMKEGTITVMEGRGPMDTLTIDIDGSFRDTLYLKTGVYGLFDGKNRFNFHIKNGNNVQISYDAQDFDNTLSFSGSGSAINNYYVAKVKKEKELIGKLPSIYALDEQDFIAKNKEIKTASGTLLATAENIPKGLKELEKKNIHYEYLNKLPYFEPAHRYYSKQPEFKVSEGFLSELNGFDYNNEEDFISSDSYKKIVDYHYSKQAYDLVESEGVEPAMAFLKIFESVPNETIRNSLLFSNAEIQITRAVDLDTYYNSFMSLSTNDDDKTRITEIYKTLKVLDKGRPSPKFVNYENYNGGITSLDDLKGKYVYIDVWATWCGPCKREIPFLKEVEKKYHEKNIEFVSISVDASKDYDKWKIMVQEKELRGIQLYADKSFQSSFVQEYQVTGIPKFILIDPQGNIVTANAPRPSEDKLVQMFDELKI